MTEKINFINYHAAYLAIYTSGSVIILVCFCRAVEERFWRRAAIGATGSMSLSPDPVPSWFNFSQFSRAQRSSTGGAIQQQQVTKQSEEKNGSLSAL